MERIPWKLTIFNQKHKKGWSESILFCAYTILIYPGEYKEWDFNYVGNGFWHDKSNAIAATKWLIEEKLKLSNEELKEQLSYNLFTDNGLGAMIRTCFSANPYKAINE